MKFLLRLESLSCLLATLVAFGVFVDDWKQFFLYFLVPDLSLLFFLWSSRVGSIAYNIAHNIIFPPLLLLLGIATAHQQVFILPALIWFAHVHFDRSLGYGLKKNNCFYDTHLGQIGKMHQGGGAS